MKGYKNQILIPYSVREKNYDRKDKTCMLSMKLSLIISMIITVIATIFGYRLITIFTMER